MNLNYLKPWKEEFSRTERFLTTVVFVAVAAYTAFTAYDMKHTLEEQGCEKFVKEFSGVDDSANLSFYSEEELERPEPPSEDQLNKPSMNLSFENYTSR